MKTAREFTLDLIEELKSQLFFEQPEPSINDLNLIAEKHIAAAMREMHRETIRDSVKIEPEGAPFHKS